MGKTNIEWADETWPVTRGCTRVSTGCERCYAESMAARIVRMGKGAPTKYDGLVKLVAGKPRWTGEARFCPEELATPLRRRSARRIFVSSMSDLFHDDITFEQIAAVFGVMAACPQHTFMCLTKRARRMREWFEWAGDHDPWSVILREAAMYLVDDIVSCNRVTAAAAFDVPHPWPLPNVMLGVSTEDQDTADERIPELLKTPAALRWISAEPLLAELDLRAYLNRGDHRVCPRCLYGTNRTSETRCPNDGTALGPDIAIDLVIAGCESGGDARPAQSRWYRGLRDQCAEAGVAFFLKQATEEGTWAGDNEHEQTVLCGPGSHRKPGGVIGAPYLDGVQHLALPEVRRGR